MRKPATASAFVLATIAAALCGCSATDDVESSFAQISVRSTEFASPPSAITDTVPTAEQLTALYDASVDFSIREQDRARLIDGPSDRNLQIARAWGAQPSPQHVQFHTVEFVGPELVHATGQGRIDGVEPYPVGPIPFVRFDDEWKVSRAFVCGVLTALEIREDCR